MIDDIYNVSYLNCFNLCHIPQSSFYISNAFIPLSPIYNKNSFIFCCCCLGIPFGHEELDLKGYENFGKFAAALESTGVAAELASGEYTIFAPTDPAMETYEVTRGPITADVIKMHIVPGKIASADVPTADLNSLGGPLTYRYAVRKHFVNDAIIGESTFGPFSNYPVDVQCSNGVIHAVGLNFAM